MKSLSGWLQLIIFLFSALQVATTIRNLLYKPTVQGGGKKIDASHRIVTTRNKIMCAALCTLAEECWTFTWDTATKECGLLEPLTAYPSTVTASSTLVSYYVGGLDGKQLILPPLNTTFRGCEQECQDKAYNDGTLYLPPSSAYAFALHYAFDMPYFVGGMYRNPEDTTTWYDMNGEIVTAHPDWEPGQPNNMDGTQYYIRIWRGYIDDFGDDNVKHQCLCVIH